MIATDLDPDIKVEAITYLKYYVYHIDDTEARDFLDYNELVRFLDKARGPLAAVFRQLRELWTGQRGAVPPRLSFGSGRCLLQLLQRVKSSQQVST